MCAYADGSIRSSKRQTLIHKQNSLTSSGEALSKFWPPDPTLSNADVSKFTVITEGRATYADEIIMSAIQATRKWTVVPAGASQNQRAEAVSRTYSRWCIGHATAFKVTLCRQRM
jgi:hypothetical protein